MRIILTISALLLILAGTLAHANPTQTGATGLITVSSADTLDGGNICVGIWGNYSKNSATSGGREAFILPVSLTLGIGTFWEFYGTYPNLLFNGKEDTSGRGTADIGTKLRVLGDRSSPFKLALDLVAQRHVSEDRKLDGTVDLGAKVITSFKQDNYGIHLYAGYRAPGNPSGISYDKEVLYGAGFEYLPLQRLKLIAEVVGNTNRDKSQESLMEGSLGMQYFLSPHLTFNFAGAFGLTKASPDWRTVFGLSTCQGVGSYVKPVPRLGQGLDERIENKPDTVKPSKIVPISPLLAKSLTAVSPVSKLEVQVTSDTEEIVIKPYGQVTIAPQAATAAVAPSAAEEVAIGPQKESVKLGSPKTADAEVTALDYTQNRLEGVTPLFGIDVKGQNVAIDTSKNSQLPEKMAVYRKFRFPDITFDFDQWSLSAEGKKYLSEVAEIIRNDKKWIYLRIDGHTDNIGSVNYNMDLSLKRAISVASYLISREGIDAGKVFLKGFGKSKSLGDNATSDGRKLNRRCEILFLVASESQ